MRGQAILASVSAIAVAVGITSFIVGREFRLHQPEPELVTGSISARPIAPSQMQAPSLPAEAFLPPPNPSATGSSAFPAPARANAVAPTTCDNANALGVSRIVEIDTTGGPGFGFEHFKAYDFLAENEVVLTFDDGPWPGNTPAVLKALAAQCTKGLFFPIGKHAMWHPEILKQVAAAGHAVGSHT